MLDTEVRQTRLENGIRVVSEYVPHANGVAVGLRVDAGARDESEDRAGISHVLEHMLFKGTERRTAREIAEEMDAVGGHIDAYTTKEYTGFGVRVLPEHVPLALDVLADMLRRSLLDEDELTLEKGVILEEYRSIEDSPEDYVHDLFARTLWPSHPLGRPVIGSPEVIKSLTRDDLRGYLARYYVPQRIICAAAGRIDHDELVAELETQFGDLSGEAPARELSAPASSHEETRLSRPTEQAHFCMGTPGVSETDLDRWAVRVLSLIVGGSMSSRLFQEIREKRGLCYSIGCETVSYREGGMFVVYADTKPEQLEQVRDLSRDELLKVVEHGITSEELVRAKNQVRAATLMSLDDVGSRMGRLGRSVMYHDTVIPLSEIAARVDAVTRDDCARAAERLWKRGEFAFAAIGPFRKRRRKVASA
ncbi:MAG: M16 family metallopeptidase [Armatimonadota bacterium]